MPASKMTDKLSNLIDRAVRTTSEARPQRRAVTPDSHIDDSNIQLFTEGLTDYLEETILPPLLRDFPEVGTTPLATHALMSLMGPRRSGTPPLALYRDILGQIEAHLEDPEIPPTQYVDRTVQFTLAYGCRWNRQVVSGSHNWDIHWPDAIMQLISIAHNFTVQASVTLKRSVRGFEFPTPDLLKSYAGNVVADFIRMGVPVTYKYEIYHYLENWEPAKGSLYGWFQRAIQGEPKVGDHFRANMFLHGWLYPLLHGDQGLGVGAVAFRRCSACDSVVEYSPALSDYCPCGEPTRCFYIISKEVLVIEGKYSGLPFRKCSGDCHEGFHEERYRQCPHNDARISQRPTFLLVRASLVS